MNDLEKLKIELKNKDEEFLEEARKRYATDILVMTYEKKDFLNNKGGTNYDYADIVRKEEILAIIEAEQRTRNN